MVASRWVAVPLATSGKRKPLKKAAVQHGVSQHLHGELWGIYTWPVKTLLQRIEKMDVQLLRLGYVLSDLRQQHDFYESGSHCWLCGDENPGRRIPRKAVSARRSMYSVDNRRTQPGETTPLVG